jgi:hypothetical protein
LQLSNPDNFPKNLDLGTIHQPGAGAIGSSFVLLLALTQWKSVIHVIDYDLVEGHNCPVSLLFCEDHVGSKKVNVCFNHVKNPSIQLVPHGTSFRDFVETGAFKKNTPDLILAFANEENIWLDIQNELPPLSYHAATTQTWGINFGRHIPLKEYCLVCRFERRFNHQLATECGAGVVSVDDNGRETMGMLPFLPTAAATLVLADLAKLSIGVFPVNENVIEFSMRNTKGSFLKYQGHLCLVLFAGTMKSTCIP